MAIWGREPPTTGGHRPGVLFLIIPAGIGVQSFPSQDEAILEPLPSSCAEYLGAGPGKACLPDIRQAFAAVYPKFALAAPSPEAAGSAPALLILQQNPLAAAARRIKTFPGYRH
jgi:hypothetical protein